MIILFNILRMKNFLLLLVFFFIGHDLLFAQTTFTGTFNGVVNEVNAVLHLQESNGQLSGEYKEGQDILTLQGTVQNNAAAGEMLDPGSGQALSTFQFLLNGNQLNAQFSVLGFISTEAIFTRANNKVASGSSTPAIKSTTSENSENKKDLSLDPQLFGTWMHESIVNSGSGSEYAGFTSVRYYTYNPDGTYKQETASAGGGDGWSASSNGRTLVEQGTWTIKNGIIHVKTDDSNTFSPMLKHFFHEGNLVFKKANGEYLIYHK